MTYEKKSGSNVLMGNDAPCKCVGIGSIQIRMHNGVVRTLIEVHHVPQLKRNLVSAGVMDSKGFSCEVKGGVMQITRKGKFVVMQGTKQGNLYIFLWSTMTESVFAISQSRSHVSSGSFDNSLWHLRLGNMSEKGLEILSKRGLLGNHKVKPL